MASGRQYAAGGILVGLVAAILFGVGNLRADAAGPVGAMKPTTLQSQVPTTVVQSTTTTVTRPPTKRKRTLSTAPATSVVTTTSTTTSSTTTTSVTAVNPANARVTVRVLNGTTVAGAAAQVTSKLGALGFNVVAPVNATVSDLAVTTVYYYRGFSVAGGAIAEALGLPSSAAKLLTAAAPLPKIYPSDVNVVMGTDLAG